MVFGCKTVSVERRAILRDFWQSLLQTAAMSSNRAVITLGTIGGILGRSKTVFDKKMWYIFLITRMESNTKNFVQHYND